MPGLSPGVISSTPEISTSPAATVNQIRRLATIAYERRPV
jgi:hypothetical protein